MRLSTSKTFLDFTVILLCCFTDEMHQSHVQLGLRKHALNALAQDVNTSLHYRVTIHSVCVAPC